MRALARDPDAARRRSTHVSCRAPACWRGGRVTSRRDARCPKGRWRLRVGAATARCRVASSANLGGMAVHLSDPACCAPLPRGSHRDRARAPTSCLRGPLQQQPCRARDHAGRLRRRRPALERALALCREHGLRFEEANTASHLGFLAQRRGDYRSARFCTPGRARSRTSSASGNSSSRRRVSSARSHSASVSSTSRAICCAKPCLRAVRSATATRPPSASTPSRRSPTHRAHQPRDRGRKCGQRAARGTRHARAHAEARRHDVLVTACQVALGDAASRAAIDRGRARSPEAAATAASRGSAPRRRTSPRGPPYGRTPPAPRASSVARAHPDRGQRIIRHGHWISNRRALRILARARCRGVTAAGAASARMSAAKASTASGVVSHEHMKRHPVSPTEHVEAPTLGVEPVDRRPRQVREDAVGLDRRDQGHAGKSDDRIPQPARHRVRMGCVAKPRTAVEHREPRRGEEAHLRGELPPCLRRRANSSASAWSKNTTASQKGIPFLVPPRDSTSTPARHVSSAGAQPTDATAFAKRAPSMCTCMPRSCAIPASARISSGAYTVPSSSPG